jgi:hypothetical protein
LWRSCTLEGSGCREGFHSTTTADAVAAAAFVWGWAGGERAPHSLVPRPFLVWSGFWGIMPHGCSCRLHGTALGNDTQRHRWNNRRHEQRIRLRVSVGLARLCAGDVRGLHGLHFRSGRRARTADATPRDQVGSGSSYLRQRTTNSDRHRCLTPGADSGHHGDTDRGSPAGRCRACAAVPARRPRPLHTGSCADLVTGGASRGGNWLARTCDPAANTRACVGLPIPAGRSPGRRSQLSLLLLHLWHRTRCRWSPT